MIFYEQLDEVGAVYLMQRLLESVQHLTEEERDVFKVQNVLHHANGFAHSGKSQSFVQGFMNDHEVNPYSIAKDWYASGGIHSTAYCRELAHRTFFPHLKMHHAQMIGGQPIHPHIFMLEH